MFALLFDVEQISGGSNVVSLKWFDALFFENIMDYFFLNETFISIYVSHFLHKGRSQSIHILYE